MLWEIGCKRSRKRRENWKKKKRKKDYGIIYKIKRPFNKVADEKQISKSLSWIFERAYSKDIDIEIRMNSVLRIISFSSLPVLCIRKFQFEICFITSSTLNWAVKWTNVLPLKQCINIFYFIFVIKFSSWESIKWFIFQYIKYINVKFRCRKWKILGVVRP